jgi:hypothetical protein
MTATSSPTTRAVPAVVQQSVGRLVAFLETGGSEGLFAPDLFADLTLPQWRIQVQGAEQMIAAKTRLHPPAGRTRVEKVLVADRGYVLKVEERWEDAGGRWYCREAFLCDLDDEGRIAELSVYCTGDWDEAAVIRHAEAVTLLRP